MRRAPERRGGCRLVARFDIDAEIAGRLVPQARGAGLDRVSRPRHGREHLIIDVEQLRRVPRLIDRLGHHDGDGLADKAHRVGRQWIVAGRDRCGARQPDREIGRPHQPRIVRQGAEPVGEAVGAGQHGEHARRGPGRRLVERDNARMRMG